MNEERNRYQQEPAHSSCSFLSVFKVRLKCIAGALQSVSSRQTCVLTKNWQAVEVV